MPTLLRLARSKLPFQDVFIPHSHSYGPYRTAARRLSAQRLVTQGTDMPVRHVMGAEIGLCPRRDSVRIYRAAAIPAALRSQSCLAGSRRADNPEQREEDAKRISRIVVATGGAHQYLSGFLSSQRSDTAEVLARGNR